MAQQINHSALELISPKSAPASFILINISFAQPDFILQLLSLVSFRQSEEKSVTNLRHVTSERCSQWFVFDFFISGKLVLFLWGSHGCNIRLPYLFTLRHHNHFRLKFWIRITTAVCHFASGFENLSPDHRIIQHRVGRLSSDLQFLTSSVCTQDFHS